MISDFSPTDEELVALTALRHDLHAHPELAFEEFRTGQRVIDTLSALEGVEILGRVAGTGVVARLQSGRPGPIIALRADMDALPIEELSGVPWTSRHNGRMHACGHDGHTAALLGAATVLSRLRSKFSGQAIFLFQPAEEQRGGARKVIGEGVLQRLGIESIFGAHNWPGLRKGQIATNSGVLMAASNSFSLTISGRSCHAAQPHCGADPIAAAAHFASALPQIRSRLVNPVEPAIISIGALQAGTTANIIPDTAQILGTIRTVRKETLALISKHLQMLAEGASMLFNCSAELTISSGYPPVQNDPVSAEFIASVAERTFGPESATRELPVVLAGEDFSFYLESIPGAFWFIGAGGESAPLHNAHYDFCDELLPKMVAMHVGCVMEARS